MLVVVAILVLSNFLLKHYSHRIGRRFVKTMEKDIFDKVLNSSVSSTSIQSRTVYVLNLLLDGNFKGEMKLLVFIVLS